MSLLEIKNLKTYFYTPFGAVKAVDGISFVLNKGRSLGLAGESGCGKTTVALSIMRILPYPGRTIDGEIFFNDENILTFNDSQLRDFRWKIISIVFQGAMASLNPLFKIGNQIAEPIIIHEKIKKKEAMKRAEDLLEMVGIDSSRAGNYPWELSGGMRQRVMIAMALACEPEMVIADEPNTALDVIVADQIMELIKKLREKLDLSMLLITHDLSMIAQTCDEVAIMYAGKIVEKTDTPTIFTSPLHPYTHALVKSFPNIKGPRKHLEGIYGHPPDLINPPSGCRFNPRCGYAEDICRRENPELNKISKNHFLACHLIDKILAKGHNNGN